MSIADKLTTIAENIPKVYQAGYDKGKAEGGGGGSDDSFWDVYQQNGERGDYQYAFAGVGWNDEIFKPKYKFVNTTGVYGFQYMFYNSKGISKITANMFDIDSSNGYYAVYMFANADIKEVEYDLRKASSAQRLFQGFKGEKVTLYNWAQTYDNTFSGCSNLKYLRIEGAIGYQKNFNLAGCPKLDSGSIRQVISVLKDTATNSTITFSKTAVTNAFELEVDAETGEFIPSEKLNEWLALVATKPNWTITLA
jgi:hypothetical protein